jgi:hypothetical protein
MQIPILNGVYTDSSANFRTAYPRNLIPVPKEQGISKGYLKPADGIVSFGVGPGVDRGSINWRGVCYRVMGSKLCSVDANGVVVIIGEVGGVNRTVTFDYSFDKLAVCSNGKLFYYDGSVLTQVTDLDLGVVLDFIWIDGYFLTTDGANLVVTELTDPFSVTPFKYGSSEADPDAVKGVLKIGTEAFALNRNTIEAFRNIGGVLFPFERIDGAKINRGALGTYCAAVFTVGITEGVAFLGSGRNEPPSVWFGINGQCAKIATAEIDTLLQGYSEADLSLSIVETRVDKGHQHLYIHLPDQTIVYDSAASAVVGEPVWFHLTSSVVGNAQYKARNLTWAYDKWIVGDPASGNIGCYSSEVSSHYGIENGWEFSTAITYNQSRGAIFHELELISLTGRIETGTNPTIWTCYSLDGLSWSQERPRTAGRQGNTTARLNWLHQGNMNNWRIQKFRGTSKAHISVARLEARIEALQ